MDKKIGVVIPVLNQFELAVKALESINVSDVNIYIIDNWTSNDGVANAWNSGVKKAISDKCNFILVINDDVVLAQHTILHMINLMLADESIGVVTATDHRNSLSPEAVRSMTENPEYEIDLTDAPDFACFMLTPESYEHIGEFDPNFFPAYFEDNDYCHRTIVSGMKCVRSQNAVFYHYGSKTQNAGPPVVPSIVFQNNRAYYVNKWGGMPGKEEYSSPFNDPNLTWKSIISDG